MAQQNLSLLTDLYELTMMQGYFLSHNTNETVIFDAFYRSNPGHNGYAICAGLEQVIQYVKNLHFSAEDIQYLESLHLFQPTFLEYLKNFKFSGSIYAIPEGTVMFPREPFIKIIAPVIEAQILETAILNIINHQSLIATKAARVVHAADGDAVLEFGLRRAQGPDAGIYGARAAVIGGCSGTSNVLAGKMFDIPVMGTHAHSWIMSFPDELTAFRNYAKIYPNNCILLVDTYDTLKSGVPNAIKVFLEMKEAGIKLEHYGIRLDSGDLAYLSKKAKKMFDQAGLKDAIISASNDLDEDLISSLKIQGAQINSWGVGTHLITSNKCPSFGGVYKLTARRQSADEPWTPVIKLSEMAYKRTVPGIQHIRRFYDANGCPAGDMIFDPDYLVTKNPESKATVVDIIDPYSTHKLEGTSRELMVRLVEGGKRVGESESIEVARDRCHAALMRLDAAYTRFLNPQIYPVGLERGLANLRHELAAQHQVKSSEETE